MFRSAISAMPLKVPLFAGFVLSVALGLSHMVGLPVEVSSPPPRLLVLFAVYLAVLSAVTYLHLKILAQGKVNISCSSKVDEQHYQSQKKALTEQKLAELRQTERFKKWQQEQSESSRSNIVYEVEQSDSEDEEAEVTCHQLATMKKLF